MGDMVRKFREFGWDAQEVAGHDVAAIDAAITQAKASAGKPSMIILNTIKGKGWSKAEDQTGSHSRGFTQEELAEALGEMEQALAACD